MVCIWCWSYLDYLWLSFYDLFSLLFDHVVSWCLLFFSNLQKSCKNSTENFSLTPHLGVCSRHHAPSLPNILEWTSYLSRIFSLNHSIAIKHKELTLIHHYHIIYKLHSSFIRIIQYPGCIWWPPLFSCFPSGITHQVFLLWCCCFWRVLLLFSR